MSNTVIKNAQVVNEGMIISADVWIKNHRIEKIAPTIQLSSAGKVEEVDAKGNFLIPGIIDDQVHFREPGLTHKADIYHESKAAVAGGVTSFMEMPNTKPAALTQELLEQKYQTAAKNSFANYSFFMGTSNDNYEEIMKTDLSKICGLKIFMGSSTGNMLVDDLATLEKLFGNFPGLIATHCEDEATILANTEKAKQQFGEDIPFNQHPIIRDVEACYKSSSFATELAKKHKTRLHILHISTARELDLFTNKIPLSNKHITSEVCVHHLYFDQEDYATYGSKIKCNPAIKEKSNKQALLNALLDDTLDIIATDHAPHTAEEKANTYLSAPSGVPLVQHSLNIMLDFYHQGKITLEKIVEKMSHAPAQCFQLKERGYIKEGYYADLALVDINEKWHVQKDNIYYKCAWSPFENQTVTGKVLSTWVSGNQIYNQGKFAEPGMGQRLLFSQS